MMNDPKRRAELAELVEQRRRELESRPDISLTMRRLSQSSNRNQLGKPPQHRLTTRALILTGAGIAALLICVLGTVAVVWANSLVQSGFTADPDNTVQQFYGALHETNYSQAYSYFSTGAKARLSEETFADLYSGYDRVGGIIQDFPIQSSVQTGNTAVVVALISRRGDDDSGQLQTLNLVKSGGAWFINSIVLGSTIPLPTATAAS
ncbi:MAG: hypothetical protein ACLQUY_03600 [Ktedonobacterales bacterium]